MKSFMKKCECVECGKEFFPLKEKPYRCSKCRIEEG